MKKIFFEYVTWVLVVLAAVIISGCAGQQTRANSSVVDYLYPQGTEVVVEPSVPVLNIPIKVGIAFVPDELTHSAGGNFWAGVVPANPLADAEKMVLLEKIAEHFRKYDYISEIEVIPSAYLTPGGSFSNLSQIQTMYGIDVIALVSYDQVQFTDEGLLSLTYWTLIGGYVVSGEKNDTSTMLDTAVFDIKSQKMLFRAPGTNNTKSTATPINLSEARRMDSRKSYELAMNIMIENLDIQLSSFKQKIKDQPEKVKVVHREGYSGGSFGFPELIILMLALICARSKKAQKNT